MNFCYFEGFVGKNIYFNKEKTMCAFELCVKKGDKAYDYLKFKAFKENVEKLLFDLEEGSILTIQATAAVEAKEKDGVPVYISFQQDANVFRGQFMQYCTDLIGEDLVNEAWETKLADATLDYGQRLMNAADRIANEYNLQYLKDQRLPPETDEDSLESKLHIVYSLAKWLIFYGKNGHGYEADF